jgi:hypothetical protein
MMIFSWVWAPCGLAGRSRRFGEAYCLHLQGRSDDGGNQRDYIGWQEGKFEGKGQSVTSVLKMETVRFSETLASNSQSTRRPNPEEHHHYRHRRENLKFHISIYLFAYRTKILLCAFYN